MWRGRPRPRNARLEFELWIHPKPAVVFGFLHQTGSYRILLYVLRLLLEALIGPRHVVKRFFLPDWAGCANQFVDLMSGSSLHALHNFYQRICPTIVVPENPEQQMDMIRHNHGRMDLDPLIVLAKAMLKNKVASISWQRLASCGAECDE